MRIEALVRKIHPVVAIVICLGVLTLPSRLLAQDAPVTVPDVIGLGVPQAAALLNRNGIVLGAENNVAWSPESGLEQNTIGAQSIPAGQSVAPGTVVDVTVLRSPNTLLIYDDNDLSMVNLSDSVMSMEGIIFRSLGGSQESFFTATRWTGALDADDCAQIWSVPRGEPKDVPECPSNIFWLTTQYQEAHFWTGAYGATQFRVEQNGIERALCPIVNPGRCEFFLAAGGSAGEVAGYVYFAYTPDQLVVRNPSDNQWMLLDGVQIVNNAPPVAGSTFAFGDPAVFGSPQTIGRINRLAPGQCLLYTGSVTIGDTLPESCDVVARLDLDPSVNFWIQPFGVNSVTDDEPHSCPAAIPEKLTICMMPR
jgi:hypothetical protein